MGFYIVMYLYLPHQPFTMMLLHRNNDLFLSSIGIMQHKISTCGTIFDRERGVDNGYRVDLGMIFCACLCELLQIDSQLIFISLWQTLRTNFTVDKRIKLSFHQLFVIRFSSFGGKEPIFRFFALLRSTCHKQCREGNCC